MDLTNPFENRRKDAGALGLRLQARGVVQREFRSMPDLAYAERNMKDRLSRAIAEELVKHMTIRHHGDTDTFEYQLDVTVLTDDAYWSLVQRSLAQGRQQGAYPWT
jgi:hypothetical protein